MKNDKVIIIGGGMAGLSLALFLNKAGIQSAVYEAYPGFKNAGVAFTIAPNGMNVLNELSITEEIIKGGNVVSAFEFKNGEGRHIARMRTGPVEKYGQPSVLLSRFVLYDLLYKKAIEQGIEVYYGKKLTAINEGINNVSAYFEDGSLADGSILIGADGINSATRRLIFPDAPKPVYVGFYGTGGLVNVTDIPDSDKICRGDLTLVYGKNGFFGYGFNKQDELLWWSSLEVPESEVKSFIANTTDEQIRNKLLNLFNTYSYPVPQLISKTGKFAQTISYEVETLQSWHKGRVLLIGDAGHAISTTSGQGASMAFEDAMCLAKLLRDNAITNYEQVFSLFENERKPRLAKFKELAKRGNSDKKVTGKVGLFIREKMMRFFIGLFGEKGLQWQYSYKIDWKGKA